MFIESESKFGVKKDWYIEDGKIVCKKTTNLDWLVDLCKKRANETIGMSYINAKESYFEVAEIPNFILHEMMKDHPDLDVFSTDKSQMVKLKRIIETEYPYLKTTTKKMWRPK